MDIGSLIRAERKSKRKTLREIADALAISPNSLWNLEKRNHGTMSGLERVCQFLGVEWIGLPLGSSLGNRIWAERLRRGWTQEIVANKAGVSRPAVARVESDRGNISSLCAVLDVIAPDIRPRKPVIRQFVKSQDVKLTPPDFVEQVVSVLGEIDLDPCGHQNSLVPANRQFFEKGEGESRGYYDVSCKETPAMATVKVYKYKIFVSKEGDDVVANRMGTAAYIKFVGGTIIEGTELEVDSSKVDSIGKTEIGFAFGSSQD